MTMVTPPTSFKYGYIIGLYLYAQGDTVSDPDALPDFVPATGTITFSPVTTRVVSGNPTALVLKEPYAVNVNDGFIRDTAGRPGVWLITGVYRVTYRLGNVTIPPITITLTEDHDELTPLNLPAQQPVEPSPEVVFVVNEQVYTDTLAARDEVMQALADFEPGSGGPGTPGKSAYQVAVDNGYVGTEAQWLTSLRGPQGDRGLQGIQGATGPKGDKGDPGNPGTTGAKGDKGDKGDPGNQGIQGIQGPAGTAATISSITASSLAAGTNPTATLGGTSTNRTIQLGIPAGATGAQGIQGNPGSTGAKGDKGDKGDPGDPGSTGPKGDKGDIGNTGAPGTAATITGATATGLAAGSTPTVTLGGTPTARTFALGIPAGAQGAQGPKGDQGDRGLQGIQGVKGDTGDRGLQGIQGIQGPKGDKGDPGNQGPAGTVDQAALQTMVNQAVADALAAMKVVTSPNDSIRIIEKYTEATLPATGNAKGFYVVPEE